MVGPLDLQDAPDVLDMLWRIFKEDDDIIKDADGDAVQVLP